MFEFLLPYIIFTFAVIGAGAVLITLNQVVKWLSGIILFYHRYGRPKRLQAIVDGDSDSFFTICKFDGFIDPNSLSIITERLEWVQENINNKVYIMNIGKKLTISFLDEQDAVAYKLRWA